MKKAFNDALAKKLLRGRSVCAVISADRAALTDPFDMELARLQKQDHKLTRYSFHEFWWIGHHSFGPYESTFKRMVVNRDPMETAPHADGSDAVYLKVAGSTLLPHLANPNHHSP